MAATPMRHSTPPTELPRQLPGCHHLRYDGRDAIENHLEELNRLSPAIERRIADWGTDEHAHVAFDIVLYSPANRALPPRSFLCEERASMGLDIRVSHTTAAPACYVIVLPLAGELQVTTSRSRLNAKPGEGAILEFGDVERMHFPCARHHVEFALSRHELMRLAAAWAPGTTDHAPHFVPHLGAELAPSLLHMAHHASSLLKASDATEPGTLMLFNRWTEMMALTLLHRQPIDNTAARRCPGGTCAPASLRRAIDFIQAYADAPIGLADIAEAACASISGLLRHFNSHLGLTPYAFLRTVRLERARAELRTDRADSIRQVALRWGFRNASKFSIAYRARFGESPSETRSRGATR